MLRVLLGLILALPFPLAGVPSAEPTPVLAQQFLSGRLGGDARLEGGCDWLDAMGEEETSRYEPLWPDGYYVTFHRMVRLWDPRHRLVAKEGDIVTVAGRVRRDLATICQVGPIYEVERILAVNGRLVRPR